MEGAWSTRRQRAVRRSAYRVTSIRSGNFRRSSAVTDMPCPLASQARRSQGCESSGSPSSAPTTLMTVRRTSSSDIAERGAGCTQPSRPTSSGSLTVKPRSALITARRPSSNTNSSLTSKPSPLTPPRRLAISSTSMGSSVSGSPSSGLDEFVGLSPVDHPDPICTLDTHAGHVCGPGGEQDSVTCGDACIPGGSMMPGRSTSVRARNRVFTWVAHVMRAFTRLPLCPVPGFN